jgi:membrane-associated phospholipid phosphatase
VAIEPARLGAGVVVKAVLAAVGLVAFVLLAQAFVDGGQVVAIDDDVSRWVADSVPGAVEWVARLFTWLGGAVGTAVVAGAAVIALWRASRHVDAAFVGLSVIGVTVLVAVLKALYERARPESGSPIRLPHSYSFPSGHAATAVVLYGALGLLLAERAGSRRRGAAWLVAAAALSLAIGASRILLNVHFVSDVAAGFAVGLAWLCCCAIVREVVMRPAGETPASG